MAKPTPIKFRDITTREELLTRVDADGCLSLGNYHAKPNIARLLKDKPTADSDVRVTIYFCNRDGTNWDTVYI